MSAHAIGLEMGTDSNNLGGIEISRSCLDMHANIVVFRQTPIMLSEIVSYDKVPAFVPDYESVHKTLIADATVDRFFHF